MPRIERRPAVVLRPPRRARSCARPADRSTRPVGRARTPSASRSRCVGTARAASSSSARRPARPVDLRPARGRPGGVDRLARLVHGSPAADHVEVLERESQRIDDRVTTRAHGIVPVLREPLADGRRRRAGLGLRQAVSRPAAEAGRASRGCCPAATCRAARARCGSDRTSWPAALRCPSRPPR